MTFLTNKQVELYLANAKPTAQDLCNENLKFHLKQISMSEEEINKVIETINSTPFTLPFNPDELVEAQRKCENTSK